MNTALFCFLAQMTDVNYSQTYQMCISGGTGMRERFFSETPQKPIRPWRGGILTQNTFGTAGESWSQSCLTYTLHYFP